MEFQARYLALFLLFTVVDGFRWFWMGSLHKNSQLMLAFLKAPFLVLHFSYYTLMTFLMVLSVLLVSILVILGIWSVARTRIGFWTWIWSSKHYWLRQFESSLLISMLEKLKWFRLTGLITLVLFMWKWTSLLVKKNHLSRWWGWLSLLNWIGAFTLSLLLKLPPTNMEPWFVP